MQAMQYSSVAEARKRKGLRLVLSAHVPGPWGETAKAMFKMRNFTFLPVVQEVMQPNEELLDWTGFRNAPVAIYEDEPAVAGWLEIIMLAERLGSGHRSYPMIRSSWRYR